MSENPVLEWAQVYFQAGLPVAPLYYRSKKPIAHPESHGWWVVRDMFELGRVLRERPRINLALVTEGLVQVDCDSQEAQAWARARGMTSAGAWVLQTRRGWRVIYAAPAECPKTFVLDAKRTPAPGAHPYPDFLEPGRLGTVPPSVHPTGHVYAWAPGHSPRDLRRADLAPLPVLLLEAWRVLLEEQARAYGKNVAAATLVTRYGPESRGPEYLALVYDALVSHLEAGGYRPRPLGEGCTARCPLHDDREPSLSLHPVRGWKCHAGCGEGRLTELAFRLGVRVQAE